MHIIRNSRSRFLDFDYLQVVQKEKRRVEDEKSQVAGLKREIQSLTESCDDVEQKRQKLATDVHTKEQHINALNGQLAHLKKSLDQENNKVILSTCPVYLSPLLSSCLISSPLLPSPPLLF